MSLHRNSTWHFVVAAPRSLLTILVVIVCGQNVAGKIAIVPELSMRKRATRTVMPQYPSAAKARKAVGVAVASITVDEKGRVTTITVLQAPHSSISMEIARAITQWKFMPLTSSDKEPLQIRSKLTFYFSLTKGRALVQNPAT
jgi:TonB family protein